MAPRGPGGRPKNAWNSTRRRKLIRLHSLTLLDKDDIRDVLRANDFDPSSSDIQKKLRSLLPPDYAKDHKTFRLSNSLCMEARFDSLRRCRNGRISKQKRILQKERFRTSTVDKTQENKNHLNQFEGPIHAFRDYGVSSDQSKEPKILPVLESDHLSNTSLVLPRLVLLDGSSIKPQTDSHQDLDTIQEEIISHPILSEHEEPGKRASSIRSISRRLAHKQLPEAYLTHISDVLRYSSSSSLLTSSSRESSYSFRSESGREMFGLRHQHSFPRHTSTIMLTKNQQKVWNELVDENKLEIEVGEPRYPVLPSRRRCCTASTVLISRPFKHGLKCGECGVREAHCKAYALAGNLHEHQTDSEALRIYLGAHRWDTQSTMRVDYYNNTPLHCAASITGRKNFAALRRMIQNGAATDIPNTCRQSFLHLVCQRCLGTDEDLDEFIDLLKDLRQRNFNFRSKDHYGRTALHNLFRYSVGYNYSLEFLQTIFSIVKPDLLELDSLGCSIMQYLESYCGHEYPGQTVDIAEKIRSKFIICDESSFAKTTDFSGGQNLPQEPHPVSHTPIAPKIPSSKVETVMQNIKSAVRLNTNRTSRQKLGAENDANGKITQKLNIESDEKLDITQNWALKKLVGECSKYVKQVDNNGNTPLIALVKSWSTYPEHHDFSGVVTTVIEMINAGANINAKNRKGDTVLAIAARQGIRKIVALLTGQSSETNLLRSSHRVNLHSRNNLGYSVLEQTNQALTKARWTEFEYLYGNILSCRVLLSDAGAQNVPTDQQEWMTEQGHSEFWKWQIPPRRAPTRGSGRTRKKKQKL